MTQFRVGQMVKVVDGPRAGTVCRVESELRKAKCRRGSHHSVGRCFCGLGLPMVHEISTPSGDDSTVVAAPPHWLRPHYPPAKWETGDEWIRRLTKLPEKV